MIDTQNDIHLEGANRIQALIDMYDEVEQYFTDLTNELSMCDKQFSDIYHTIKDAKLTAGNSYKFCREIKRIANERANIKKNLGIRDTFNNHRLKINERSNRGLLATEIYKREKSLDTQYKNRVYSPEDMQEMLGEI